MSLQYDADKERTRAEMAVYWDELEKHLPDSLERAALGDQKIYRAFAETYPKMKEHIIATREKEIAEEVEKINYMASKGIFLQSKEHAKDLELSLNAGAFEATKAVLSIINH